MPDKAKLTTKATVAALANQVNKPAMIAKPIAISTQVMNFWKIKATSGVGIMNSIMLLNQPGA